MADANKTAEFVSYQGSISGQTVVRIMRGDCAHRQTQLAATRR